MPNSAVIDFDGWELQVRHPLAGVFRVSVLPKGQLPACSPAIAAPDSPGLEFQCLPDLAPAPPAVPEPEAAVILVRGQGAQLRIAVKARAIALLDSDGQPFGAPWVIQPVVSAGPAGSVLGLGSNGCGEAAKPRRAIAEPPASGLEPPASESQDLSTEPIRSGVFQPFETATGWCLSRSLDPQERLYGLGERTGFLDRRHRAYTMWNTDDPSPHLETTDAMYVSIPWLISLCGGKACGIFLNEPGWSRWDLGKTLADVTSVTTAARAVELYLIAGPLIADAVRRFVTLTGRPPLPPRWALGYHQSRYSYASADEIREVAHAFANKQIPCDAIHADIDYMQDFRVFTWDAERFPHPRGLIAELAALGIRLVTIIDPGVKKERGYLVYDSGLAAGVFCQDPDGLPYQGRVWPGRVVFPDFARPAVRAWWGNWHRELVDVGVGGIWNDMNEPADFSSSKGTFPLDVSLGDRLHRDLHNLYGHYEAQATYEGLLALRPQERPFVLTRAGFAGSQRYGAVWTGDNFSIWPHLEQSLAMHLGLGLSGWSFVGCDVGGFSGDCQGELLARWTQIGAFTPFFRNHTCKGTAPQEPWAFGRQVEAICRNYIKTRYELLCYLYTAFWHSSQDGTPVLRPLVWDFQSDPECEGICDQALVGPALMVAPIVRPGVRRRLVYFPRAESSKAWIEEATGRRYPGGSWQIVEAPLERLPLFVLEGTALPRLPGLTATRDCAKVQLVIQVFPASQIVGEWYEDDGLSLDYREGEFEHWLISGGLECESGGGETADLVLEIRQEHRPPHSPPARQDLTIQIMGHSGAPRISWEPLDQTAGEPSESPRCPLQSCEFVTEAPTGLLVKIPCAPGRITLSGLRI